MANRKKNSEVFRQKSLERVSSPENLDTYIKSTTPALWLLLSAVIVLLTGIIIWGSFGKIDSASVIGCEAENGTVIACIKETEYGKLCDQSCIEISGVRYDISSVAGPFIVSADSNQFLIQAAGIESNAWYYTVTCKAALEDGDYKGRIVYEKISPITFIIN